MLDSILHNHVVNIISRPNQHDLHTLYLGGVH